MAETEGMPMSRQEFSVAYDGSARLDGHSIDVRTLAPALMAFGKLLREANIEFNGKKTTTKVLVVSDFEHKCFNVNFELVLGWYEQVKQLLGLDEAKTAKEVLEWVGLIKPAIVGASLAAGRMTYLQFLKWRKGREIIEEQTDSTPAGFISISIKGDGNKVEISPEILRLAKNPKALKATQDAFLPLGQDGFDTMRVSGGELSPAETFKPAEVEDIIASCAKGIEESKGFFEPEVEDTPAWLSVYSPVYDEKAEKWRFRLGRETIYADISETTIAHDAMLRGGSFSDDSYQVVLEVTTPYDQNGKPKDPSYKIKKVVRFVPASPSKQGSLFGSD